MSRPAEPTPGLAVWWVLVIVEAIALAVLISVTSFDFVLRILAFIFASIVI